MASALTDKVSPFLSYLQKRMDFIAQVATSAPSWCLLTDFDTLIDGFTKQYCLIKNIVRSHQGTEGGPDFEPWIEKVYSEDSNEPPLLDIPHGEIGAQAFYTILENIVRNTAKYGDPTQLAKIKDMNGDGKLRFAIVVHDDWDDDDREWVKDYYKVQIIDQLESANSPAFPNTAVAKLNTFLSEYLTDPITGVVKPKNWGMKEIKICAAYLRMVKQDEIDLRFEQWSTETAKQPPIINVSLESREGRKHEPAKHLTYTLYLLRPKQARIVGEEPGADEEKLRLAGVDFSSLAKFLDEINAGFRPRHTFIVLPKPQNSDQWNWLWKNRSFLPPRLLIRDCTEAEIPAGRPQLSRSIGFAPAKLPADPGLLIETLWTNWVNRWWGGYKIFVRDRLHANTIAEAGNKEDWDEPAELPEAKWLVFDHKAEQDKTKLFDSAAYHQGFGHGSNVEQMLKQKGKDAVRTKKGKEIIQDAAKWTDAMANNYKRLRIRETAGLSVAVIDERVWLEKDGSALEGIRNYVISTTRFNVWRKRRVFLQDANKALDNFPQFVENLDPPDIPVFDFIIIHQGIIDSIKDKERENFDSAWRKLRNSARWMVIDSGRGQPEQAREDNLRWVEYSNLAECLVQHAGDKFKLAELLWTLRASAKNGA